MKSRTALSIAGAVVVAIGSALALSDLAAIDVKGDLDAGDAVMWVAPDGDGYAWQGPYIITAREVDRVTLDVNGETRVADLPEVMPLSQWQEREQHKRGEHK